MYTWLGPLSLLASAGLLASFGVLIRVLNLMFTPIAQVSLRMVIAALILFLVHATVRTTQRLSHRQQLFGVCLGFFAAVEVALFTYAILSTTLSYTLLSLFCASICIGIIGGALLFNEELSLLKTFALCLALVGISIYSGGSFGSFISLGTLAAIGSGVMYGAGNLIKKLLSEADALLVIQYKFAVGALITGIGAFFAGEAFIHTFSYVALATLPVFGVLLIVVNRLLFFGFRYTSANTGSIILSSELVFAAILGYIFYTETLTTGELLGSFCIVIASILASLETSVEKS